MEKGQAGSIVAAQRIMGLTLLRNWRDQGRPEVGLKRWRKDHSKLTVEQSDPERINSLAQGGSKKM